MKRDINECLKAALTPSYEPDESLNGRIMERGRGKTVMRNYNFRKIIVTVVLFLVVTGSVTAAYAAHRLLTAQNVASQMGEERLADRFSALSDDVLTEENDIYRASYLGEVSGKKLSQNSFNADEEKTYFVVAIERKDEQELTEEENITVSPFVGGIAPWNFNIYSMGGSAQMETVDGVLYCLYECGNLELFADRGIYLGVTDQISFADSYRFDKETGKISRKEDYKGLNLLFTLAIDPSKADSDKAEQYLQKVKEETTLYYSVGDEEEYDWCAKVSKQKSVDAALSYLQKIDNDQKTGKRNMDAAEKRELKRQIDFYTNGIQDLENPEGMIQKSKLIQASVKEVQEDENGYLDYMYGHIGMRTPARAVRKNGLDTSTFYGENNKTVEKFIVIKYVDGKFVGSLYKCK